MKQELTSLLVGGIIAAATVWYFKSRIPETSNTIRVKSVAMGVRG